MTFRTLALPALALALGLLAAPAQAQIKLRYAHVGVANAPQTLYADEVAKLVKARPAGRVEIQVVANSQLGGVGEMVDGVKSGALAMGHHDFASLGQILPGRRLHALDLHLHEALGRLELGGVEQRLHYPFSGAALQARPDLAFQVGPHFRAHPRHVAVRYTQRLRKLGIHIRQVGRSHLLYGDLELRRFAGKVLRLVVLRKAQIE